MSKAVWRIRPVEIKRVVKAVREAGLTVTTVEIDDDGTIRVLVDQGKKS